MLTLQLTDLMLNIDNTEITDLFVNGVQIDNAYLNGSLIFERVSQVPFTATYNIATDSETLTLPVTKDYQIDWGDGTTTTIGNSHFYANSGVYTVKMVGVIDDFSFNNSGDKDKIIGVQNWGGFLLRELSFGSCSNLEVCVGGTIKTVSSGQIRNAFNFCPKLRFDSDVVLDFNGASQTVSLQLFNANNGGNGVNVNIKYTNAVSLGCRGDFRIANSFNSVVDFDNIPIITINQFFQANTVINTKPINVNTSQTTSFNAFLNNATAFNKDISDWDYSSATDIRNIMAGKSAANYDYQYYDNLLIKWASGASNGGLDFTKLINFTTNFGSIQYSSAGAAAHDSLTAQGLAITDGGQRQEFIATYNIATDGETLALPVTNDYEVDWGDGVTTTTENSHVYSTLGVYTVKMVGLIDDWNNSDDIDPMVDIVNLGSLEVGFRTFGNANQLSNTFVSDFNITGDSASYLFGFSAAFNPTIPININFDNVSDADCSVFFNQNILLNQDLSITGVTNSINLSSAFRFLFVFNSNISLPNGIKVTNLSECFNRCFVMTEDYLLLNNVDTSECTNFSRTYQSCTIFNKDVSWIDFRSATNVSFFMGGKLNSNYDYQYYDNLLIKWASGAANGGLDFTKLTNFTTNFGTIQYSSAGAAAHASLISQGLAITDGGQNAF